MKRSTLALVCLISLALMGLGTLPAEADGRHHRHGDDDLDISVVPAPVAPDGDVAGAATDIVVTFRDVDPSVPGIGLKAGATIRVELPPEFRDTGDRPVASTGSFPDCAPPLVSECSTAVLLQGWPQSPVLPFPAVTHEVEGNTIVLTAAADWLPAGELSPGPKQVHLMLFGFSNPERPGRYRLDVEIQPDPADDEVLEGSGKVRIKRHARPRITPNSQANGAPPPPFPNPLAQTVNAGESSLTMAFYLWDRDANALVGVDFPSGSDRVRPLHDADGNRIGTVRVRAPRRARNWSLSSGGPSAPVNAFISGIPTGRLTASLATDPDVAGTYRLQFRLAGGNSVVHTITTG